MSNSSHADTLWYKFLHHFFFSLILLILSAKPSLESYSNYYKCVGEIHGDWYTPKGPIDYSKLTGKCNIEIRNGFIDQEEFLRRYAYRRPVILRKTMNNEVLRNLTSQAELLSTHGTKIIRLSSANTYSYKKLDTTLLHYVHNYMKPQDLREVAIDTYYFFGDNNFTEWKTLFSYYSTPPYKIPGFSSILSFGIAGPGSGVPFHYHGPVFAETLHGRKHWLLYPPNRKPEFDPNQTSLQWLTCEYKNLKINEQPLECSIQPDEVIYIPDGWWHATLNMETTVFMSTFLSGQS